MHEQMLEIVDSLLDDDTTRKDDSDNVIQEMEACETLRTVLRKARDEERNKIE